MIITFLVFNHPEINILNTFFTFTNILPQTNVVQAVTNLLDLNIPFESDPTSTKPSSFWLRISNGSPQESRVPFAHGLYFLFGDGGSQIPQENWGGFVQCSWFRLLVFHFVVFLTTFDFFLHFFILFVLSIFFSSLIIMIIIIFWYTFFLENFFWWNPFQKNLSLQSARFDHNNRTFVKLIWRTLFSPQKITFSSSPSPAASLVPFSLPVSWSLFSSSSSFGMSFLSSNPEWEDLNSVST